MPEKEFLNGIAFSNLAGSRFSVFLRLIQSHKIEPQFYWRAFLNGLISAILSVISLGDSLVYFLAKGTLKTMHPPIFILGHWRSGTTHLHNLMCMDERAGFTTTYQTVFPNHLFGFKAPLIWLMRKLMPATRPVDNVKLDPNNPQEEEFGLGNVMEMSYYNWWYFPADWDVILDRYLTLNSLPEKDRKRWQKNYLTFIKRGLLFQNKNWYISKNPPNTARIKVLLDIFPDARFIYIHRNPYEVFVSSQRFFKAILGPLQLQSITETDFNAHILKAYCALFDAYETQKILIPKNRLVEINYADFMQNELRYLRYIYTTLDIKLPENLVEKWTRNIGTKKHKEKSYTFSDAEIDLVNSALGARIEFLGYEKLNPSAHSHGQGS